MPPNGLDTFAGMVRGDRLGHYCDACSRFGYVKNDNLPGSLNIKGMTEKLSCNQTVVAGRRDAAGATGRENRIVAG
jgi:hypothetical protein